MYSYSCNCLKISCPDVYEYSRLLRATESSLLPTSTSTKNTCRAQSARLTACAPTAAEGSMASPVRRTVLSSMFEK